MVGIPGDGTGVRAWYLAVISGLSGRGMVWGRRAGQGLGGRDPEEAPSSSRCEAG